MNRTTQNKWIAALCIVAMAGCASDQMSGDNSASGGGMSSTSGGTGSGSSSGTGSGNGSKAGATSGSSAQATYGVVAAIDQMQRQDVGVGAVGAAAAGGSTGIGTDRVYRVTVRMEDGSSQMVVVDSAPSYRIGDRVRYDGSSGTLVSQ